MRVLQARLEWLRKSERTIPQQASVIGMTVLQEQPYLNGFLMLSLLVAGALPAACGPLPSTATAIPTSIQEWLDYRNPALGFSVEYLHDWSVEGPVDQFGPWIESWPTVTFASDLYGYGEQAFGKYAVVVAVGESRGATVTETVEYSLSPIDPEVRATIERHCCFTVGGEPAMELLLSGVMSRWGTCRIVVLHEGREYWLSFAPYGPARDGTTLSDELARAAFDTFLRTFTFIPLSATPAPTPTITPVPTPP